MICEIVSNYFQSWQIYWKNKKGISSIIETQLGLPPFKKNCGTVKEVGGVWPFGEGIRKGVPMYNFL